MQVNTLVAAETADDLAAVYHLLIPYEISRWSLFFLISVGRGKVLQPLEPAQAEDLMRWIYHTGKQSPFFIATTEAPSYRRIAIEEMRGEGLTGEAIKRSPAARGFRIRDGNGVMFVSQSGDVCPAGFLPLPAGNVRRDRLVDVYRRNDLFRALHDPGRSTDGAVSASFTCCAVAHARGPMRRPAIRWPPIRCARWWRLLLRRGRFRGRLDCRFASSTMPMASFVLARSLDHLALPIGLGVVPRQTQPSPNTRIQ